MCTVMPNYTAQSLTEKIGDASFLLLEMLTHVHGPFV